MKTLTVFFIGFFSLNTWAAAVPFCTVNVENRVVVHIDTLVTSALSNPQVARGGSADEVERVFRWMYDLAQNDPEFLSTIASAWCGNRAALVNVERVEVSDFASSRSFDEEYYSSQYHITVSGSAIRGKSRATFLRKESYYSGLRRQLRSQSFRLMSIR